MSIVNNCLEYLLGVAEKIIAKCVDKQTSQKYFNLKEQVMEKFTVQLRNSTISGLSSDKENNKSSRVLRMSTISNNSTGKSKKATTTRQSIGKSIKNKKNDQLERVNVQYLGYKTNSKHINSQNSSVGVKQYSVLLHMASIIKNAQSCPSMLKTITFKPNNFSKQVDVVAQAIASSLTSIYQVIHNQQSSSTGEITPQQQNPSKINQLIIDNKWLLSKLQAIINENIILRRMSGLKVND